MGSFYLYVQQLHRCVSASTHIHTVQTNRRDTAGIESHHHIEALLGCRVPLGNILIAKVLFGRGYSSEKNCNIKSITIGRQWH